MISIDIFLESKVFKKYAKDPTINLKNIDRIIGVLFWPIAFIILLVSFFKSYFENK
tara:strand:- start:192 stop:359 length:168 start_codon:yes stop_codon:yes gene_type:complete